MLGRAVDAVMDWIMDDRGSLAIGLGKILFASSVAMGVLISPFLYWSYSNGKALENLTAELDNSLTEVFTSVADCSDRYTLEQCQTSQDNAVDISNDMGTTISYDSRSNCLANHGTCRRYDWDMPVTTTVGNMTTTTYIPQTDYLPPVVAWQAATSDIEKAVPLYSSNEEGVAVRWDGKKFDLTDPYSRVSPY